MNLMIPYQIQNKNVIKCHTKDKPDIQIRFDIIIRYIFFLYETRYIILLFSMYKIHRFLNISAKNGNGKKKKTNCFGYLSIYT